MIDIKLFYPLKDEGVVISRFLVHPLSLANLASQARTSVDRAGWQAPPHESYYQHLITLMEVV